MAPLIIAHRGDSAHRPENTLAAFASALEVGADLVELDVQMTRDGQVVVLHDASVDRTTDGRGPVQEMTLAEIRRLSAGFPARFGAAYAGERVPVLPEALGMIRGRARIMVELKADSVTADGEGGIEARALYDVRRAGMEGEVVIISFDRRALLRCRELAPQVRRGHIFCREEPARMIAGTREVGSELVMPEKGDLSQDFCDQARAAGIKVATWVVDEPAELQALARFDLYGVGSNRPGVLLDAIWEHE